MFLEKIVGKEDFSKYAAALLAWDVGMRGRRFFTYYINVVYRKIILHLCSYIVYICDARKKEASQKYNNPEEVNTATPRLPFWHVDC
jgi:hypothetical protein